MSTMEHTTVCRTVNNNLSLATGSRVTLAPEYVGVMSLIFIYISYGALGWYNKSEYINLKNVQ